MSAVLFYIIQLQLANCNCDQLQLDQLRPAATDQLKLRPTASQLQLDQLQLQPTATDQLHPQLQLQLQPCAIATAVAVDPFWWCKGPWATAKQLEEDLQKADPGVSGVYVVKVITQTKTVDGKEWFKIHWQGYSKSESTWEPVEHLVEWGLTGEPVLLWLSSGPPRKLIIIIIMVRQLHCDEVTLAVMELMRRHHLTSSVEFYVQRYTQAVGGVQDTRLQELCGKEYQGVLCSRPRLSVPLQMNPESKKPSPELPEGDEKCRLLVMGHLEPDEWKAGAQGAPVVGDSTFRQLIAAGLDEDDAKVNGTLKNRKCKPANRKTTQLWRKLLVTDQDGFNAETGQHCG